MTTTKKDEPTGNAPEETTPEETTPAWPTDKGRLVLVTGSVVSHPVEGLAIPTEHYDSKFDATVPVTGRFVVDN